MGVPDQLAPSPVPLLPPTQKSAQNSCGFKVPLVARDISRKLLQPFLTCSALKTSKLELLPIHKELEEAIYKKKKDQEASRQSAVRNLLPLSMMVMTSVK